MSPDNESSIPPLTPDEVRDAQFRAMLVHHELLARQISELSLTREVMRERLAAGEARMSTVEGELRQITTVTTEVRDILQTFKSGMRVLGYLGTAARWAGYLATAGVAVYTLFYALTHGGQLPGKHP